MHHLKLLLILCALMFYSGTANSSETVIVTVEGLSEALHENVIQHLTIFRQKDNERLQESRIKKIFIKGESEIKSVLAPLGYYNPVIDSHLEKAETGFNARYTVQLGQPVIIDEIFLQISGQGKENQSLITALNQFGLRKGAILEQNIYKNEKQKLVNIAFNQGFPDSAYSEHSIKINRDTNIATIHLTLNTGKQYYFGETTSDQQLIKPQLLHDYLPYKKGDPYKPSELLKLQTILNKTNYFSRVIVQGKKLEAVDYHIPIDIEVEKPTSFNEYSLGAGYATDTGLHGKVSWDNRLFNSSGHKVKTTFLLAELEKSGSINYRVPLKDAHHNTLNTHLSYQEKLWDDTDTEIMTVGVTRSYIGTIFNFDTSLVYRNEDYIIGSTSGQSELLIPTFNIGFVAADDLSKTNKGIKASLGILGGLDGAGSDDSFLQITLDGKVIFSPFQNFRVISRGSFGTTYVDSIDSVPPSLRFYAGGDSSIRGYKYKSIGAEDSSGTVIGGTHLIVGSIEGEQRITEAWSVAAFWDIGSATDDLELDFYQGAGFGVRFRLPFGQVRLDFASALSEEDRPWRIHLTVGGDL